MMVTWQTPNVTSSHEGYDLDFEKANYLFITKRILKYIQQLHKSVP